METNKVDAAKIFVFFAFTIVVGYFVFFSGGNSGQQARIVPTENTMVAPTETCPGVCDNFNVHQLTNMMKMPKGCVPGVYDEKVSGVGACSATVATSEGQCISYKGRWQIMMQNGVENKICYTGMIQTK